MTRVIITISFVSLILAFMSGCSACVPTHRLVGKWQSADMPGVTFEFTNTSMIISMGSESQSASATFRSDSDGNVMVCVQGGGGGCDLYLFVNDNNVIADGSRFRRID
jgi:hypothetical protein